jgi:hypothetical protein
MCLDRGAGGELPILPWVFRGVCAMKVRLARRVRRRE